MLINHLVQAAIDWSLLFGAACGPLGAPCPCNTTGFLGFGAQLACPGSAFTPVAAAYQTQGMWVQADLIQQIRFTGLGSLAALMYLCSAIGGLIGVALGAPPKMYLWFFMGPPMFHFLVGTPYAVKGTEWRVADQAQDQRQVWRMAEVGLLNSNWSFKRNNVYNDGAPASTVDVSWFFAYYDNLVSNVIQNITAWTGLYNLRASTQNLRSGVGPSPSQSSLLPSASSGNWLGDRWWLLSNSKWSMVEDITNSRLANPKIRDALATFMSSECGDSMMRNMNSSAFLNAMYYKGRASPGSVFRNQGDNVAIRTEDYEKLFRDMYGQRVPLPRSVRDLLKDHPTDKSSLVYSLGLSTGAGNEMRERMINMQWIRCPAYLHILLEAFRWEAGQIYHNFRLSAPDGISEEWLSYYLLYGWNVRKQKIGVADPAQWPHIQGAERTEFLKNLILVHLIRNEMMIMPANFTNRKLSTRQTEDSGEGHLRFIATKNKFSEMYQWALMVPHMQGILLYYLAIAFPFCAMMMVVPGYHKVTFTWMTFWLWAKMWDLGFAMVTSLERTVWAMIGNNSAIQGNLPKIAELADWGRITVTPCSGPTCAAPCGVDVKSCLFSKIDLTSGGVTTDLLSYTSWATAMKIFDRAVTIAANLDLDLSNSYYIYIMAGLYFSVPVVVGQLVLGAKSGSASLVGNIIGAVGQEAGRQGAAGHQSDMIYRMKAAKAAVGQEAYAKQMRASGLAGTAIGYGNEQVLAGMNRAGVEAAAAGARSISQAANLGRGNYVDAAGAGAALIGTALDGAGAASKARDASRTGAAQRVAQGQRDAEIQGFHRDMNNGFDRLAGGGAGAGGGPTAGPGAGGGLSGGALGLGGGGQGSNGDVNRDNQGAATPMIVGNGAGGASVLGRIADRADGIFASSAVQWGLSTGASALNSGVRAGNYEAQLYGANTELGATLVGNQATMQGFGYGQQGALFGQSENRVGAQAEYDGRMAAWEAENAYSNQFASLSTALGFFAGGLEAGSKPVDRMGMAMSGDFGANTQSAARAVTPGSWMWGRVSGMQESLEGTYGQNAVRGAYITIDPQHVMQHAFSVAGQGWGNAGSEVKSGVTGLFSGESTAVGRGSVDLREKENRTAQGVPVAFP